jgi:hypothetical protein
MLVGDYTDIRLISSDLTSDQISKLKGSGKNGMLTKGDVLKAMGKIKNAYGSAEKMYTDPLGPSGKRASEVSLFLFTLLFPSLDPSFFVLHLPMRMQVEMELKMEMRRIGADR